MAPISAVQLKTKPRSRREEFDAPIGVRHRLHSLLAQARHSTGIATASTRRPSFCLRVYPARAWMRGEGEGENHVAKIRP